MIEEDRSQKIVDAISRKEKFTMRILRKCNENGEINISLDPAFKPRRNDASFCISLVNFATTNLMLLQIIISFIIIMVLEKRA